jgi:sigma-B regulation protein RsbU (phosphoserine phosphatase)
MHVFHMLTYKGMPDFLTVNDTSNRTATLWIVGRLVFAVTVLIGGNLSNERKCTVRRGYFFAGAIFLTLAVIEVVTWQPSLLPVLYIDGQGATVSLVVLEYLTMVMLLIAALSYFRNGRRGGDVIAFTMSLGLFMGAFGILCFLLYPAEYDVVNVIGHIIEFVSINATFKTAVYRNVIDPHVELTSAQKELKDYVANLDRTVEQRTRELQVMNSKLMEDMEYAREIQDALLPQVLPDTKDISFVSVYLPTDRISGDSYDVFLLNDRYIGFYVSDASGHGVPAAMLNVFLKQCIDNIVEADRDAGTVSMPSAVLLKVYEAFNHTNFKDDVYIVLVYCIYDRIQKRLIYCSAGMNVLPLLSGRDGGIREIEMNGFPICKLSEVCEAEYYDHIIPVRGGDQLFLYTDGLPEALNGSGEYYSNQRLKNLIARNRDKKLFDQCRIITGDFADFRAGKKADDDVTLLAVEFREGNTADTGFLVCDNAV